jgi:two-component system OmpR family response regulator
MATTTEIRRVLYVEDEPSIRTVGLFALVEVGGFTVEPAESGAEALAKVGPFSPDLVLLDVMMPGMDGLATYKALRARPDGAGVPIIFMTAKVQPHEVDGYRQLGAVGVIAKPFDPVTLSDEIRGICARRTS